MFLARKAISNYQARDKSAKVSKKKTLFLLYSNILMCMTILVLEIYFYKSSSTESFAFRRGKVADKILPIKMNSSL